MTFTQRGIKGNNLSSLLVAMKKHTCTHTLSFSRVDLDDIASTFQSSCVSEREEVVVLYKGSGIPQTKAIFYAIRCAFAHGAFEIRKIPKGENVYVLENKNRNGRINALLQLR